MHEIDAEKAGNTAGTQPNAHILVVDDEVALTRLLVELLEYHGYRVMAMDSSGAALAFFEDNYPAVDLVVADETMPGMTGLELLRRMRALRPDLPTIRIDEKMLELMHAERLGEKLDKKVRELEEEHRALQKTEAKLQRRTRRLEVLNSLLKLSLDDMTLEAQLSRKGEQPPPS